MIRDKLFAIRKRQLGSCAGAIKEMIYGKLYFIDLCLCFDKAYQSEYNEKNISIVA